MQFTQLPKGNDRLIIRKNGASDTVKHSFIALPLIVLFELIMMVNWIIEAVKGEDPNIGYLIGYIALTVLSVATFLVCLFWRNKIETRWKWIEAVEIIYAVGIVVWALAFTHIDAIRHGTFSPIINITIAVIVPLFTFLNPFVWLAIELADAAYILFLWGRYMPNNTSFLINYSVFAIIFIVASASLYVIRSQSYQREILLQAITEGQKAAARTDELTKLPNRRAYAEQEAAILEQGCPEDLILLACDINGLKQTNDTKGHQAGDLLITSAADILHYSFSPLGTVYRTGGDEFIGILHAQREEVEAAIEILHEKEAACRLPDGIKVTVAIGFSVAKERSGQTFHDLEVEADALMYQDKKKCHQAE